MNTVAYNYAKKYVTLQTVPNFTAATTTSSTCSSSDYRADSPQQSPIRYDGIRSRRRRRRRQQRRPSLAKKDNYNDKKCIFFHFNKSKKTNKAAAADTDGCRTKRYYPNQHYCYY